MSSATSAGRPSDAEDALRGFDAAALSAFREVASHLIPAAHGMPAAGDVVDDARLQFVLETRPDLVEPLSAALAGLNGGPDAQEPDPQEPNARLRRLESERPELYGVLTFVIVAGYYTDAEVRQLIGYPGQERILPDPDAREAYLDEGLIEQVIARGPVWKDPATGRRAEHKEPS